LYLELVTQEATREHLFVKILRQPISAICAVILCVLVGLAVGAYLVIPDNTANANRQIPQKALSFPGTSQTYVLINRGLKDAKRGFLKSLLSGKVDNHEFLPYDTYNYDSGELSIAYSTSKRLITTGTEPKTKKVTHWAGTDTYGRDVLSRLILGLRVSIFVGFLSVLVSLLVGVLLGSIAGFYGGIVDKVIMLIINTSWSIPTILLAFAIIIALGKGFLVIVLAVGLTMWVDVARIVRGQVLQLKEKLFIQASKTLGLNSLVIIWRHILPNLLGTITVMGAANFATAILVEAGLSFLGLGIQPPTPSLGNMLQEGYAFATGGFVYLAFFPIVTIMILVLCFNLLGTTLRDIYDVKTADG